MGFKTQGLAALGAELPIIQAPMVGTSTPQLAAAVSNAGGLGSLGLGGSTVAQARQLIQATRELTTKPVNYNFFCHQPEQPAAAREQRWLQRLAPYFAEFAASVPTHISAGYQSFVGHQAMLEMLLDERPEVVSFHFGLPSQAFIDALKQQGTQLLATATCVAEAQLIERAGIDFIVAQGFEAGGHRGVFEPTKDQRLGTFALVQRLAEVTQLPLIAAGGVMNAQGIRAALQLGAVAVQMGTAFVLCPESSASAAYRAALTNAAEVPTEVSALISGRPARGLVNRWHTEIALQDAADLPDYPIAYSAAKALQAAASAAGNQEFSPFWAGQAASLAQTLPAAELLQQIRRDLGC